MPADEATVSVFDSGLIFGDGVFESIRVYGGRVFRLHEHVRRLYRSADALSLDVGMSEASFTAAILDWLRANNARDDFHFRPIVTRGKRFPPRLDPRNLSGGATILLLGGPVHASDMKGIRAAVSLVRRTSRDAVDPTIKHLSYVNNVLAHMDGVRRGADQALLLDRDGHLTGASTANLFVVRDGRLCTPRTTGCIEGITRATVMALAADIGIAVEVRDVVPDELGHASEVFLTGTSSELTPVVEVDGAAIGSGGAGALTLELARRYRALVRADGVPIDAGAGT